MVYAAVRFYCNEKDYTQDPERQGKPDRLCGVPADPERAAGTRLKPSTAGRSTAVRKSKKPNATGTAEIMAAARLILCWSYMDGASLRPWSCSWVKRRRHRSRTRRNFVCRPAALTAALREHESASKYRVKIRFCLHADLPCSAPPPFKSGAAFPYICQYLTA